MRPSGNWRAAQRIIRDRQMVRSKQLFRRFHDICLMNPVHLQVHVLFFPGFDCGLFICKYASCILQGQPLEFDRSDISREEIRSLIKKKCVINRYRRE